MSAPVLALAIGVIFVGLFGVMLVLFGVVKEDRDQGRLQARLAEYEASGRRGDETAGTGSRTDTALGSSQVTRRFVGVADRVVADRGFDSILADSLAGAAVKLRPGEWLALHFVATLATGLAFLLLSSMSVIAAIIGLGLGFSAPYLYLNLRRSRRRRAFYSALPDTLQMLAGSLATGYSLQQAVDAVVRETDGPIHDEFSRALIEARLGTPLESALEDVAVRMASVDLGWVVMAIRIQREVGGNLSEVLTTVAGTLRERERIRRQAQVLSAEGRISAVILGALPIVFTIYLAIVRPKYLSQLFMSPIGVVMVVVTSGLFVAGIFWLRKTVQVDA